MGTALFEKSVALLLGFSVKVALTTLHFDPTTVHNYSLDEEFHFNSHNTPDGNAQRFYLADLSWMRLQYANELDGNPATGFVGLATVCHQLTRPTVRTGREQSVLTYIWSQSARSNES